MHLNRWIVAVFLLFLVGCGNGRGELKPLSPTATPGGLIAGQPQLVTLAELQADPYAYQDQIVRVSGSYHILPEPECSPYNGPGAKWALIADNLRLDVVGHEATVQLVSRQTAFTVDGLFRLYEGPMGCGKEPATDFAWYLDVLQIVQPNPLAKAVELAQAGGPPLVPQPLITPTPMPSGSIGSTAQPTAGASPTGVVPTATTEPLNTVTPTNTPADSGTPTATSTAGPTSDATATATLIVTSTPTPQVATPTVAPTEGPSPTPFPTQPPLPTSTPGGGYPPPPTAAYP